MSTVPNQFPRCGASYRLAVIGEAPGREEEAAGQPFIGASGRLLTAMLHQAGISRDACFIGNISQVRPPDNDIRKAEPEDIEEGEAILKDELTKYDPNLCVLLGNTPLRSATNSGAKVTEWRGSLFLGHEVAAGSSGTFAGRKCMATYHPAAVLRQYEWCPVMGFDLKRARQEGESKELVLPVRTLVTPGPLNPETYFPNVLERLRSLRREKPLVSLDIEGTVGNLECISFASSATESFIVPFRHGGGSYWPTVEMEMEVWKEVSAVLTDPGIPKLLQNSLYDNFVLSYSYRCPIVNVREDTMLKHWECYCELPKGLGFQASIYTKEPYYKAERKANDVETYWRYCCKDSAITAEINSVLETQVKGKAIEHYRFNVKMLRPLLYMELKGIRYDYEKAKQRQKECESQIEEQQGKLEAVVGHPCNIRSPKFKDVLFRELGLPAKYNRTTGAETTNYEALLTLAKQTDHPAVHAALRLSHLRTRSQMLRIHPDTDGRIRCGYNVVGTETGRLTCYTSPTGSGYNLQTIPDGDRDLFLADPGCEIFQCDLAGADGWTIAAWAKSLGDPTMMDDLLTGIKVAKVIALMFMHGPQISALPREELRKMCDSVSKKDPIYFGSKCCYYGCSYGMGKILLSKTIFLQSEGDVNISAADAGRLQQLLFVRYPGVQATQREIARIVRTKGYLQSASGHIRILFGRRADESTVRAALSNEPQENTTYATNLAALRLWEDPENRRSDGSLRVEPLHQVHDAIVGQWRIEDREFGIRKLHDWFDNELVIRGQIVKIPFEGGYGPSWGQQGGVI